MVIIQKKSSGTWWKCLLSFIGGFIFAFVAVAGGIAIVGTQFTLGEILGLAGPDVADTVLTVEYQQKTAFDAVMSFVNKEVDYMTLGGLSKVTPLIDTYLGKLNDALDERAGFTLDIDELKTKQYTDIPQYLIDIVKQEAKLGKLLGVSEDSDAIMKVFCYERNEDGSFNFEHSYTIGDFLDNEHFVRDKIDSIRIRDVVGDNPEDNVLDALKDKTLKQLQEDDVIGNLLVSDVFDITDTSPKILKTFRDNGTKINEMSEALDNFYLSDVYESNNYDSLPPAMKKLLGNTADPVHYTGNPVHINYEDYGEVIFSHGNDKTAEGYVATDYVTIKSFFDKDHLVIAKNSEDKYVANGVGTLDRSGLVERVFDIDVERPTDWDLYVTLCNKPTRLKELDASIDELELKDVINIEPTSPLYKIRHTPIKNSDEIFNAMKNNLTIKDIFGDDLANYKFINALPEDTTISGIGNAINNMQLIKAFEDNIYDSDGNLNSMWKYLLIESDEAWITGNPNKSTEPFATYESNSYTLGGDGVGTNPKGINQMIDNMKYWMENQKLGILQADGMITVEGNLLTSNIPANIRAYDNDPDPDKRIIPADAVTYGDLTTKQFIELMAKVPLLTA